MANILKRGNSYQLRVSAGYNQNGKQIFKTKTWKIPEGMTDKKAEKEAKHQAELFEEQVKLGQATEKKIKFADFADMWIKDYAVPQLRIRTVDRYKSLIPRINKSFGQYTLDKIRPAMLIEFYNELSETKKTVTYRSKSDFSTYLKKNGISKTRLSEMAKISFATVKSLCDGKNVSAESAKKISSALKVKQDIIFETAKEEEKLSSQTVLEYHRLISVILNTAVHWQYISSNPAERVKPPKVTREEAIYLDDTQAIKLLEELDKKAEGNIDSVIPFKTAVEVLLFTGMRRGELLGLEWSDINEKNSTISIQRSLLYTSEKGLFIDDTKNYSSRRTIKVPNAAIESLKKYKEWKISKFRESGSYCIPSGRIFSSLDGKPIHPDSLTSWFRDFISETTLPQIHIHSLRHTNATLMIANGVSVTTVAGTLGHSNSGTTTRIYAHAIQSAEAASAQMLNDLLKPKSKAEVVKIAT